MHRDANWPIYPKVWTATLLPAWKLPMTSTWASPGALLLQRAFINVVEESVLTLIPASSPLTSSALLDTLLQRDPSLYRGHAQAPSGVLEEFTEIITDQVKFLEADADYLKLGSIWQQGLARDVKASSLRTARSGTRSAAPSRQICTTLSSMPA